MKHSATKRGRHELAWKSIARKNPKQSLVLAISGVVLLVAGALKNAALVVNLSIKFILQAISIICNFFVLLFLFFYANRKNYGNNFEYFQGNHVKNFQRKREQKLKKQKDRL